jgi:hypothetical protein
MDANNKFIGTIRKVTVLGTSTPREVEKDQERQEAAIDAGMN